MFAEVNQVQLYYEMRGQGIPLMCMHGGLGADHSLFLKWFAPLQDRFQMIYYDHRGNGRSQEMPQETYTHKNFVADADALRKHLGHERIALLGHSYGGFIALEYALTHPQRLSHLILVTTAPSGPQLLNAANQHLEELNDRALLKEIKRSRSGGVQTEAELRGFMHTLMKLHLHQYDVKTFSENDETKYRIPVRNQVFQHELPNYDVRHRLSDIQVPTLILAGRHDWQCLPEFQELMANSIPQAQLVFFENSGHIPYIEEQEKFLDVLQAFLDGVQ